MIALVLSGLVSAQLALGSIGDRLNIALNLGTIAVVVLVAVPLARSKRKDGTIKDLNDELNAKERRISTLTAEVADAKQQARQIEQAANHCQTDATRWRAKYEELQPFTAEKALEAVLTLIDKNDRAHMALLERNDQAQSLRHTELMASLKTLNASVRNGH